MSVGSARTTLGCLAFISFNISTDIFVLIVKRKGRKRRHMYLLPRSQWINLYQIKANHYHKIGQQQHSYKFPSTWGMVKPNNTSINQSLFQTVSDKPPAAFSNIKSLKAKERIKKSTIWLLNVGMDELQGEFRDEHIGWQSLVDRWKYFSLYCPPPPPNCVSCARRVETGNFGAGEVHLCGKGLILILEKVRIIIRCNYSSHHNGLLINKNQNLTLHANSNQNFVYGPKRKKLPSSCFIQYSK